MFITATEVTVLSNISCTAGTITAGGYIEAAEDRLNLITNNYFQTGIDVQGEMTYTASTRTILSEGVTWTDQGFAAGDICYIFGSYRNDGYVEILSISNSTLTCVTGTTVVSELSGASTLISVCSFPRALKYTLAQMVKYDCEDRKAVAQNIKSRTLGPWSETYKNDGSGTGTVAYGYPDDIIGQLAPYTIVRCF